MQQTHLKLQPLVVIVVDDEADAAAFLVRDPERHHAQHLHVLQATITAAAQRDLVFHAQMYAEERTQTAGALNTNQPILLH